MGDQREYLEICDERGASTGAVEERSLVHAKGLIHRTVRVWVYGGSRRSRNSSSETIVTPSFFAF
jgi:hypothetical protein